MKPVDYQTALGIETGDIVTTSYGSGPYVVVKISTSEAGVHLVCKAHKSRDPRAAKATFWINGIKQSPEGRYFSYGRDEVFVQKPESREPMQMRMF